MSENNTVLPDSVKNLINLNNNNQKVTFPNLLLPKKNWHIIREKSQSSQDLFDKNFYNMNAQNIKNKPIKLKVNNLHKKSNNNLVNSLAEKQFYKTSGTGFNKIKNFKRSQKIIDIDYNNRTNYLINNNSNEKSDMELILLKKIDEIKKELQKNENTFIYNQKIMQKKLDEKENEIITLKNELEKEKNNKKNEFESIINENNINFMNTIKKYKKKLESLENKNKELTEKNFENEKTIENLENKNKNITSKLNDINKKYDLLIEDKSKTILEDDIKLYIQDMNQQISELQIDINNMNDEITFLNQENRRLKYLTKEIIEARNETEIFFLDALNEAKKDLYKLKKEKDKRGSFFPTLKNYYETPNHKVDIRELTPEMREKILRNLFEKINKGYDEKNFVELNNIIEADLSDSDDNKI